MFNGFLKKNKSRSKAQAPKSRSLRMEYLESRELLSVTPVTETLVERTIVAMETPPAVERSAVTSEVLNVESIVVEEPLNDGAEVATDFSEGMWQLIGGKEFQGSGNANEVVPSMKESKDLIDVDSLRNDVELGKYKGSGFTTVIIDTGITQGSISEYWGNRVVYQYDFAHNDSVADDNYVNSYHGTNVAGIAAGNDGIAPEANVIVLKVFQNTGEASNLDVQKAVQWCVNNVEKYNIASVNLSLGARDSASESQVNGYLSPLFEELKAKDVIVCCAAGNEYDDNGSLGCSYPASDPSVISVGAVCDADYGRLYYSNGSLYGDLRKDVVIPFSQRADYLSVLAPGGFAITAAGVELKGTSQASPMIAGLAVIAQQIANEYLGRSLTVDEFKELLQKTGKKVYDSESVCVDANDPLEKDCVNNTNKVYTRVDAYKLMKAIRDMNPGTGSQPDLTPYKFDGWSDSLVISTVAGAKTDSSSFTTSDTIYASFGAANLGSADSGAFDMTITLKNSSGSTVETLSMSSVGFEAKSGGVWTNNANYNFGKLSAGTYTVTLTVDSGKAIAESNENNNTYTRTFTVKNATVSQPDLAPYTPSGWSDSLVISTVANSTTNSSSFTTSDTIYASIAQKNLGTAAAGAFVTSITLKNSSGTVLQTLTANSSGLAAQDYDWAKGDSSWNFGKLSAGTYTLTMTVDSRKAISESNENNNAYTRTFTVVGSGEDAGDTIATATPWNASGTLAEQIGNGTYGLQDVDVYKVYLTAGKTYEFETAEQSGKTTIDTFLRVANSSGTVLVSNDDGGSGTYSLASYTPTTSGYYYVAVSHYYNWNSSLTTTSGRTDGSVGYYTLTASSKSPAPLPPTDLKFGAYDATNKRATLSWTDNATNEVRYEIQSSTNGGEWKPLSDLSENATSRVCSGLLPGNTYSYRIRAVASDGTASAWVSATITPKPVPLAPTNLKFGAYDATNKRATLSWTDNATNEARYEIQSSTNGGASWTGLPNLAANATSRVCSGLQVGTTYMYRVRAVASDGTASAWVSVSITPKPVPLAPTNVKFGVYDASTKKATLSWTDNATNEDHYEIQSSTNGGEWKLVANLAANTTSRVCSSLLPGNTYSYRIRAVASDGTASAWGSVTITPTFVAAPTNVKFGAYDATNKRATLAWTDNATNESYYEIQSSTNGGEWKSLSNLAANATSRVCNGLQPGTTYSYRIRAVANGSASAWVSATLVTPKMLAAPESLTMLGYDSSTGRATLAWVDVEAKETAYEVQSSTNGGAWTNLPNLSANSTSRSCRGLVAGNVYRYRLRAVNAGGFSDWVEITLDTSARLDAPTALTMVGYQPSTGKATLAWVDNTDLETRYEVQSSTNGGKSWNNLTSLSANSTSRVCAGLTAGQTFIYRIRAANGSKVSDWASIMFYAPPASSSAVLASEVFANPFDESDFFADEDEFDVWARVRS